MLQQKRIPLIENLVTYNRFCLKRFVSYCSKSIPLRRKGITFLLLESNCCTLWHDYGTVSQLPVGSCFNMHCWNMTLQSSRWTCSAEYVTVMYVLHPLHHQCSTAVDGISIIAISYCFLIQLVLGYHTYSRHIAVLQSNSSKEEEVGQVPSAVRYDLCKILFNMNAALWRSQSHAVLRPSLWRDVRWVGLDIGPNVNSAIMTMCFVSEGSQLTRWLLALKKQQPLYLNDAKLWSGFDLCNRNVMW